MKKIVICGGHLTPALALISELKREKNLDLLFFGRKYATEGSKNTSAEFKEVESQNLKFINIKAGRLSRKITIHALVSYAKIPVGFFMSFYYLLRYRPKLIVAFGGYLSLPVVFCGWLLGIDSICHEQAVVPGLANKMNSLFAKKIFITWQNSAMYFPKEKTEFVGNLTRKEIFQTKPQDIQILSFISKNPNYILITGGNQGSHFINNLIFKNAKFLKDFSILHILGTADYGNDHQKAKSIKSSRYFSCDFVTSRDIGAVLNGAAFLITRSGANTVWELAILGKPAILIPLPHAASQEQLANAKILENAGSAIVASQKEINSSSFFKTVEEFTGNLNTYKKQAERFKKSLTTDAALKVKSEIAKSLQP